MVGNVHAYHRDVISSQNTLQSQQVAFVTSVRNLSRDVERNIYNKIKPNKEAGAAGEAGAEDAQIQELKKLQKDVQARMKNSFKGSKLENMPICF